MDAELDEIRAALREMLPDLKARFGVSALNVFGSRARGDARPESDLDLLVEFEEAGYSLWDFIGLEQEIGDRLGLRIDLVDRRVLRPELRPFVEADVVAV